MTIQTTPTRYVLAAASIVAVGAAVAAFVPLTVPGYDTSFTLAWGRDLTHGLPMDFTHASSPTPHPLAILGGLTVGFLPVPASIHVATGFVVVMVLTAGVLLALVTRRHTSSHLAVLAAVASFAASAAVWLLVMNAASDITYLALGLTAVLLTLRVRYILAICVFMVAALLRPEAALLALVPLTQVWTAHRQGTPLARSRVRWKAALTYAIGVTLAAALWLIMGALGGKPLIGLTSAAGNAETNNNPQGLSAALTSVLPGLAGVAGWLTVFAAAVSLALALVARGRHRPAKNTEEAVRTSATLTTGTFITVAMAAYLAQGLLGTPLVARYLLLPAVLTIAVAANCVTLAGRLARTRSVRIVAESGVALALIAGSVIANVSPWRDVAAAREIRDEAFTSASQLLDTELARNCTAPIVVRSPAVVALTALHLDRPLTEIAIAGEPDHGVLLQPLTLDAAKLAGYGPMTPLEEQAVFPQTAPPRESNAHWALYSTCQP